MFNRNGSFVTHLNISPRMPDGMAQMYHGWERTLFQKGGWQYADHHPHQADAARGRVRTAKFKLNYWGPTGNQKDTRVEIRKAV